MTKQELIEKLERIAENGDAEIAYSVADDALLEYISDTDITKAYDKIEKWYA